MALLDETANGVSIIAATPFSDTGAFDLERIDRMVDFCLERGADGLAIPGETGEAPKWSVVRYLIFLARMLLYGAVRQIETERLERARNPTRARRVAHNLGRHER